MPRPWSRPDQSTGVEATPFQRPLPEVRPTITGLPPVHGVIACAAPLVRGTPSTKSCT